MRYANPTLLRAMLNRIDKAIAIYKEEEFENNAMRVMKGYDQAEQEFISDKKIREAVSEDEKERLYYLREQGLAEEAEDILRDFDREYYLGYREEPPTREDEIANLLALIKADEINQKAYGSAALDGDHVYPLPVSAESIRIDPDTIPF